MTLRYPPATWKGNGKSGGSYIDVPAKVVLHTTETEGLPGYTGGATAPHLTYNPKTRKWFQHTNLDTAARALRNLKGGVETNRAVAFQVEIICYSAKYISDQKPSRLWVGDLPDTAYDDLRAFVAWTKVPLVWPGRQALTAGQSMATGFRLSGRDWLGYHGVIGHQHVPENVHWDPGAFDWAQLIGDDMAWNKPEDGPWAVQTLEDIKRVHAWQGNTVLRAQDVGYDEDDAEHLDERMKIIDARLLSVIMELDGRKQDK